MTTGRINQVAFTYTHGYLAILGKFNQLSGRLKPSVPLPNVAVKSSASNKVIHRKSVHLHPKRVCNCKNNQRMLSTYPGPTTASSAGTGVLPKQKPEVFLIKRGSPFCHQVTCFSVRKDHLLLGSGTAGRRISE